MRVVIILLSLLAAVSAQDANKRALTHADYDGWKSIRSRTLSKDGRWVAFQVAPQIGDGELVVRATSGETVHRHPRGSRPQFTHDARFVVFRIEPAHEDQLRYEYSRLKKKGGANNDKKAPKVERPLAGLGILDLATGKVETVDRVKSFRVPLDGPSVVIYHHDKPQKKKAQKKTSQKKAPNEKAPKKPGTKAAAKPAPSKANEKAKEKAKKKAKKKPAKYLVDGTDLTVRYLDGRAAETIRGVTQFGLTSKKAWLHYACSSKKKDANVTRGLFAFDLASGRRATLVAGAANFRSIVTDREVTRLAFMTDRDDRDAEKPAQTIWTWDFDGAPERIIDAKSTPNFPRGQRVSRNRRLTFSRDGSALLFGVADPPAKDLDPIPARYEVKLDLWHWNDPLLQPMQAKQAARFRNATLAAVWHVDAGRMTLVGLDPIESVSFLTPDGSRALATDSRPYGKLISWDGRYSDVWVINTVDGSRRRVVQGLRGGVRRSTEGRWLVWFDGEHWHAQSSSGGPTRNLTKAIPVRFAVENWDTPQAARAYGLGGWTANDEAVLLYDRFDIWKVDPASGDAQCLTDGVGRLTKTTFRYRNFEPDRRHVPANAPLWLTATNTETMASGFWIDQLDGTAKPRKVVMRDAAFRGVARAENAERYVFDLSTFRAGGDVWTAGRDFTDVERLHRANPQQDDVRWGDAELVQWRSADGTPLKGILIKPDGFDPSKKYPLMVYFYEKLSAQLHRYRAPAPGTSPNPAYYVSNGYLWFMPDIAYRDGYPGESCLKCVVSGVQKLIERGYVDEDSIGAAGHSWGGYQTAYLVTRTNIFKAVESGAPVSNMTSAYGGIRWGSGMSRAFQYERTQSRIGGSLWRYPMRYLENSPVFAADKVETPVLMLHNDQDGAVPWYQGIEYFCALRRLGKEVYMFNYVGGGHGLRKRATQRDWTKRMQQYFDHHLRGKPAPDWMKNGVPFVDRTREKRTFSPPPAPPKPLPPKPVLEKKAGGKSKAAPARREV